MIELSVRQLKNIEIAAAELGRRGNAIAAAVAQSMAEQKSNRDRRDVVAVDYACLFQLGADFHQVTGLEIGKAARSITAEHFDQLEASVRKFAENKNAVAKGIVMAIDRPDSQTPEKRNAILFASHAQVFQLLVAMQMAMDSKRDPREVQKALTPNPSPN